MKIIIMSLTLLVSTMYGQTELTLSSRYLAQPVPGLLPTRFASGLVSTDERTEFGSVFSEDGTVFYYAIEPNGKAEIRSMRFKNNAWTSSESVLVHDTYSYNDPFLSPDEKRLYFISNRALDGKDAKKDYDIWYIQKQGSGWSAPVNAGKEINSSRNEYYMSFTKNGTMYFSSNVDATDQDKNNYDIYYSENIAGVFQKAKKAGSAINTEHYEADVFVAPDESYLIFCADRPGGYGRGDLYISFRNTDGTWGQAKNMGKEINAEEWEYCPYVSANGDYFFYTKENDIYWVDAKMIKSLR